MMPKTLDPGLATGDAARRTVGTHRFRAWVTVSILSFGLRAWGQTEVPRQPEEMRSQVAVAALTAPSAGDVRVDATATTVTLKEAVAIALEKNPMRKAAVAEQGLAAADVKEARAALLPRIVFSESATRGNDPVYAFGTRLRQGRFAVEDFALNRLNSPLPLGNFSTRLGGQWNLFHAPDWLNVRRAEKMRAASAQQLQRTDQETVLRVVTAYYGFALATNQQHLAEQQLRTADSILQFSKTRYDSGVVVESDYLAAQVNHAGRRQELIRARNAVSLARAQLVAAMGLPAAANYQPTKVLAEHSLEMLDLPEAERRALASRPDLKQVELQQEATQIGVRMAKSAYAPRLGAFASWEQDNPTLFAGGGANNWTSGIELQIDLFTGGQKTAQLQRARAMQEKLSALRQAAMDNVRLEVRGAWYQADAARQQLEVARAAVTQSEESLRINQTRYQAGLTTITDLLRSDESMQRMRTDYSRAQYGFRTALANLELAMGTLNENSPVVQ